MTVEYSNKWFSIEKASEHYFLVEDKAENGAVILCSYQDDFIFVKTYRHAQEDTFIECPRGYGEPGETSKECALRELFEETGFKTTKDNLIKIGVTRPNTAILKSRIDVYCVELDESMRVQRPGDEVIQLVTIPKSQIEEKISNGLVEDGFTLSALALYWSRVRK